MRYLLLALCGLMLLTGCSTIRMQTLASGEAPLVIGPAVRSNRTPLDSAMACYDRKLAKSPELGGKKLQIAIGEIRDYTGKVSDSEGYTITQGGSLMLFSGLYKLKDAVNLHDRFDTRVTDLELKYIGLKQLGDGKKYEVNGQEVEWVPYYGGSVMQSEYTILGGITELNYNIQSGGAEVRISQVGPAARVYTLSVAVDLRLVNTRTLEVVSAVSMQKQFTGYEVGFELFRFFGIDGKSELFDVNIGNKSQEPLQLGIRAILEESAMSLIADATQVSYSDCMPGVWGYDEESDAAYAEEPVVQSGAEPETDDNAQLKVEVERSKQIADELKDIVNQENQ